MLPGAAGTAVRGANSASEDAFVSLMEAGHRIGLEVQSLEAQEKFGESEPLHRQLLAQAKACLVAAGSTGSTLTHDLQALATRQYYKHAMDLGYCLICQVKTAEGLPLLHEALAWCKQTLGPQHPDTLAASVFLAQGLAVGGTATAFFPAFLSRISRAFLTATLVLVIRWYAQWGFRAGIRGRRARSLTRSHSSRMYSLTHSGPGSGAFELLTEICPALEAAEHEMHPMALYGWHCGSATFL